MNKRNTYVQSCHCMTGEKGLLAPAEYRVLLWPPHGYLRKTLLIDDGVEYLQPGMAFRERTTTFLKTWMQEEEVVVVVAGDTKDRAVEDMRVFVGNRSRAEGRYRRPALWSVHSFVLFRLEGKVAIVTGAASGIGEEAVRLFVENGASVVVADVQDELGQKVVASIGQEKVSYLHCDVRDEKQVQETVSYALEKYGSLDIFFSNAGIIGPLTGILDLDIQGFDNTMATNVRGAAATIKHAARAMVDRKIRGSIICTTSVAASLGGAGPHAYTTSKHALLGLVRTACHELGKYGIRVNCISPFGVGTPLSCKAYNKEASEVEADTCAVANLKGIVLKARHVAEAALFLASDESAYISGHNLVVDGGFTVVTQSF
ncbi:hypothetical protein RJ640_021681 [Escallonia rubra]|uniref:Uncharacterized protein n=1 Tax=Escallonia rubra TaxID=112253 RepID=A0AA88U4K3_9ASTE|nr:hypothetical protein RJ640_021681 [Escallonia rubra]